MTYRVGGRLGRGLSLRDFGFRAFGCVIFGLEPGVGGFRA